MLEPDGVGLASCGQWQLCHFAGFEQAFACRRGCVQAAEGGQRGQVKSQWGPVPACMAIHGDVIARRGGTLKPTWQRQELDPVAVVGLVVGGPQIAAAREDRSFSGEPPP